MSKKKHLFATLSEEKIAKILRDYANHALSFRDVTDRHGIGKETLIALVRRHGVELRSKTRRGSWLRPPRRASKPGLGFEVDAVLEKAKLVLRRRGSVVYGAEVTNGARAKGMFKYNGTLVSRDQLLAAAGMS